MKNLLFLLAHISFPGLEAQNDRLPNCSAILKLEVEDRYTNYATVTSIFHHVYRTGCFICSTPLCENYNMYCSQESETKEIPMYNNILEFGLTGKYFPTTGRIRIDYKEKGDCVIFINIFGDLQRLRFGLEISQCYRRPNSRNLRCDYPNPYSMEYLVDFNNLYCLYFGLAIVQPNVIHVTASSKCNKFAGANFDENFYDDFIVSQCNFNETTDKPRVKYRFTQERDRIVDGVPIILPCSPGGFAVDPQTGRFVIDETCWKMYSDSTENKGVGINFIINRVYGGNENLLFPTGNYSGDNIRPIYINPDGSAKSRSSMAPIEEPNILKGNKTRLTCEYEFVTEVPFIRMTVSPPPFPLQFDENGSIITTTPFSGTRVPHKTRRPACQGLIRALQPTVRGTEDEEQINAYIHGETGCFVCAAPICDYYKEDICPITEAAYSLPVYNKIFEFGLSGKYMPESSVNKVILNENCFIKVETFNNLGNVSFFLQECDISGPNKTEDCRVLQAVGMEGEILFNNWYCAKIAISFHDNNKIFYATSFRCDKFATSQLNDTNYAWITHDNCYSNRSNGNLRAEFSFVQEKSRLLDGVPIIVPCSPGGYAVDPETGRFTVNETCDDMFWETVVNTSKTSGIHFVINNIYKGDENLFFLTRSNVSVNYPIPIYIRSDGTAIPAQNMIPVFRNNSDFYQAIREKCFLKRAVDTFTIRTVLPRNISSLSPSETNDTLEPGVGTEGTEGIEGTGTDIDNLISSKNPFSQINELMLIFFVVNIRIVF